MKPFQCKGCGVSLGDTDGDVLWFSAAMVSHPIALTCIACGAKRIWRPLTVLPIQKRHETRLRERFAEKEREKKALA